MTKDEITRKIQRINKDGSLAVVLPKTYCQILGWGEGDIVGIKAGDKPGTLMLFKKL